MTSSLSFHYIFLLSVLVFNLTSLTGGYAIHSSCNHVKTDIRNAADEALKIAAHALHRVRVTPHPGDILDTLLGTHNADYFSHAMQRVINEVRPYTESSPFGAALIKCSTDHMIEIPGRPDHWVDVEFPQMLPLSEGDDLCPDGVSGLSYETDLPDPKSVVILCLRNGQIQHPDIGIFDHWNNQALIGITVEIVEDYLSETILHEFFHAIDPEKWPGTLPGDEPEQYDLHEISELRPDQKMHNAESFAMLAAGLYFRLFPIDREGVFQHPYPKAIEPPRGPHPEDSSPPNLAHRFGGFKKKLSSNFSVSANGNEIQPGMRPVRLEL